MRSIANRYMEMMADEKSVDGKYKLMNELIKIITDFEIMNDIQFMRFGYSRTNMRKEIEVYEIIFFSDMFSLLVKKDYSNNGELVDCAVMEFYNGDEL